MSIDESTEFMPPHLADLIEAELKARGWETSDAASLMGEVADEYEQKLLALEMFLSVRDRCVVLHEQGNDFAVAFGVHRAFFDAIHSRWVEWANAHEAEYLAYKERRERELCEP